MHSLLKAVEQICQEHPGDILPPLLNQVIEFSLDELTKTPQDPLPASAILVALGQNHCNNVSTWKDSNELQMSGHFPSSICLLLSMSL